MSRGSGVFVGEILREHPFGTFNIVRSAARASLMASVFDDPDCRVASRLVESRASEIKVWSGARRHSSLIRWMLASVAPADQGKADIVRTWPDVGFRPQGGRSLRCPLDPQRRLAPAVIQRIMKSIEM